jgi:hypothetical protein
MQWPGWRHDGGDGRTGPMATEVTAPTGPTSRCRPVPVRNSRVSPLRGFYRPFSRVRRVGRTGVGGSATGLLLTMPHSVAQRRGVSEAVPGRDSQARCGVDSPLTRAPANVSALNAPAGGEGVEAAGSWGPRAIRSLARGGCSALDRDGSPLKGASSPRARRNPARGGAHPPSEAEPHPRGRPVLKRGGVLSALRYSPRAK